MFIGDKVDMMQKFKDVRIDPTNPRSEMGDSAEWKGLRRLKKLQIYPRHRGVSGSKCNLTRHTDELQKANVPAEERTYFIDHFIKQGAKEYKFQLKNKETGVFETASIYQYFLKRYDITLLNPELPLVQTTKKGVVFPMEVVVVLENQKYPYKLDELQVSRLSVSQ